MTNRREAWTLPASCASTNSRQKIIKSHRNITLFNPVSIILVFLIIVPIVSSNASSTSAVHISATTTTNLNSIITTQSLPVNPYTRTTHELLLDLRQQMLSRSIKFDEHFRSLLSSTKVNLHNLFIDTYGIVYERNTEIFTEMFANLEQYYATGQIMLTRTMEEFFVRLYQKIFQVFNVSKSFNADYLQCATEQLAHLKPFKEVPDKLMTEIRHVFVAARTFNQALNYGIDIIKHIISLSSLQFYLHLRRQKVIPCEVACWLLGQPAQCDTMISEKLLRNNSSSKACPNFCEQVLTKCFGRNNLDMLNDHWRNYVVALDELATKLSTSYDIETIIKSMDVQISEAIMNFQENGTNVSNQVFSVCGSATTHFNSLKPTSNRIGKRSPAVLSTRTESSLPNRSNRNIQPQQTVQRQAFSLGSHLRTAAVGGNSNNGGNSVRYTPSRASMNDDSLTQDDLKPNIIKSPTIIDEIRSYMSSTKNFWSLLPNQVCTSNRTLGSSGVINITNNNKKQPSHMNQNCFSEQMSNVNVVSVDTRYRKELILQISRMDDMHAKILSAMKGIEIDWDNGSSATGVPNGRAPAIQAPTTTTTTTTTEAPDDEELEDPDDTTMDPGSGEYPFNEPEEDSTVDPMESDYSETDDEEQSQTESPNKQDQTGDKPIEPSVTFSNDIDNSAKEPQTSSSMSKLVITFQDHVLLVTLLKVALAIVMLPQLNLSFNQLSTSRSQAR